MEASGVQKIARVLNSLVAITLLCNLIALPLVPGIVYFRFAQEGVPFSSLQATFAYDVDDGLGNLLSIYLRDVWAEPYTLTLTLFLLFSGICTAVILQQGRRVLATILQGTPFSLENAAALHRLLSPLYHCCCSAGTGDLQCMLFPLSSADPHL